MIPVMGSPDKRKIDVDDKDYIDLFLNDGYDEEMAADDFDLCMDGWWSNEWVPADWMEASEDGRD